MSLAINRILLQHAEVTLVADKIAARAILAELKAMLAPYNLRRHRLVIRNSSLMVDDKGRDNERFYWQFRGKQPVSQALYRAGDDLFGLPDAILHHLQGVTL